MIGPCRAHGVALPVRRVQILRHRLCALIVSETWSDWTKVQLSRPVAAGMLVTVSREPPLARLAGRKANRGATFPEHPIVPAAADH
jgi:hypothetical protein